MKIVYIYTSFAIAGGADRVVIEKANYLAEKGYDITIVTDSQMGRPTFFPISTHVKLHDLAINFDKEYQYLPFIRIFVYMKLMKRYRKSLEAFLMNERPNIVITTLGREIDFLTDIKDGSIKVGESHIGRPYIRNLHLLDKNGLFHSLVARKWMKKISQNCTKLDSLVLLTEEDEQNWKDSTKTYVIPNALPFYPKNSSKNDNKQAIFVGRMSEQKGYEYLIDIWEKVYERHPDWVLNVYGDGELKQAIQIQIKNKQLDKTLHLNGTTPHIIDKYLESSICIMSSRFEGFGMVLLEAMACGVPCVAFDCPYGPSDIIKNETDGLLVKHLDCNAMAESICFLIEHPNIRKQMGERARENVLRFNKDDVMKKWIKLFDTLYKHNKTNLA